MPASARIKGLGVEMAALYRSGLTLRVIAEKYNYSHERVRQLVRDEGVVMRATGGVKTMRPCPEPGCSVQVHKRKWCDEHNPRKNRGKIKFPCGYCGKPVEVSRARHEWITKNWRKNPYRKGPQTTYYCDKLCQGNKLAGTYGFGGINESEAQKEVRSGVGLVKARKAKETMQERIDHWKEQYEKTCVLLAEEQQRNHDLRQALETVGKALKRRNGN